MQTSGHICITLFSKSYHNVSSYIYAIPIKIGDLSILID